MDAAPDSFGCATSPGYEVGTQEAHSQAPANQFLNHIPISMVESRDAVTSTRRLAQTPPAAPSSSLAGSAARTTARKQAPSIVFMRYRGFSGSGLRHEEDGLSEVSSPPHLTPHSEFLRLGTLSGVPTAMCDQLLVRSIISMILSPS